LYPTSLERQWHIGVDNRAREWRHLLGLVGTPAVVAAPLGAVLAIPLWAFAPSLPLFFVGAFTMLLPIQAHRA
jgi:hypothetical protein